MREAAEGAVVVDTAVDMAVVTENSTEIMTRLVTASLRFLTMPLLRADPQVLSPLQVLTLVPQIRMLHVSILLPPWRGLC